MASSQLYAVFDVRERGEFNECQIPHATSLPRSQIEFRIAALVPDRNIPVIVYDEGAARAPLAAATLLALGYQQVSILDGGLNAWQKNGRPVVSGVNVPSKAFGEKVQHERNVPELTPEELRRLQERSAELVILDMRTPEEFGRFCIPGGINVPGGDLILWADELKRRKDAAVVVNCAGRTRSIIGAAALRRLGLTNVRALRNGTMGWVLAGFELEHHPARPVPSAPPTSRANAAAAARRIAAEEGIPSITVQDLARLVGTKRDMHYLLDVRSEAEYAAGHVAGSLNVPGGQAVQRADDFIAVRNAPIVFISQESARAVMAAYWYRQMGFPNVSVADGGISAWSKTAGELVVGAQEEEPLGFAAAKDAARRIGAAALKAGLGQGSMLILDVGSSVDFESAHVPGARWISRGWIESRLPEQLSERGQSIVVSCPDGRQSVFAAQTLAAMGYTNVQVLDGGVRAWSAQGFATEQGSTGCLVETNDVVLSPSIRGNKEEMQRYLDWEVNLTH
jgi:rhodanese-related sulfurtransferase